MHKLFTEIIVALVLVCTGTFTAIALADNGSPTTGHIGICHHTGNSVAHEWIYITPDASGVFDGHGKLKHQFEEDIIPVFSFVNAHGMTISYAGHNLTTHYDSTLEPNPNGSLVGADILSNRCVAPSSSTTTTTKTSTGQTTTTTTTATNGTTTTTPSTTHKHKNTPKLRKVTKKAHPAHPTTGTANFTG